MNRTILMFCMACALALAQGCGREQTLDVGEFAPYVERFEEASRVNGTPLEVTDLVIRFGEMQTRTERGACEIADNATPVIMLREDTWALMDEAEREELLFHEMGHCVLRRTHKSELNGKGLPGSIMNPYLIRGHIYQKNQSYYLRELFAGSAPEELIYGF